jgi:hypothetical protein
VSNERVVQAAEAVEELRQALELWSGRDLTGPNSLHVHRSGPAIIAAADAAIRSLMSIREQTVFEVSRYRNAQDARVNELLTPADAVAPLSYTCGDCGAVFPVDPEDPFESHGAYLDHQAEHDDTDPENCAHCGRVDHCDRCGNCLAPCCDSKDCDTRCLCAEDRM